MLYGTCFACIVILTDHLHPMMKHVSSDRSAFFMNYFALSIMNGLMGIKME